MPDVNTTQPTSFISEIQHLASLAAVRTSAFGTTRRDKEAGTTLDVDAGAVKGAYRANLNILAGADELHQRVLEVQRNARQAFTGMTSTWDAEGWRLLPNALFMDCAGVIKKAQDALNELKDEIDQTAPDIISRAQTNLGASAARVKWPDPQELSREYSLSIEFVPVPDGSSFAGLPPKVLGWLQSRVEASVKEKTAQSMREPMERLAAQLVAACERMDAADAREDTPKDARTTRTGFFKDSLVSNLQATVGLLAAFNLTNDPVFGEIVQRAQTMVGDITPDGLRADRGARGALKGQAREVLGMVGSYTGKVF